MFNMEINEASNRWTLPIQHWKQALDHYVVISEDRTPELGRK
tara:strand:- start:39227 stop:39352 length:126 start_codon:yes stop_codon:yes gene_type:complete